MSRGVFTPGSLVIPELGRPGGLSGPGGVALAQRNTSRRWWLLVLLLPLLLLLFLRDDDDSSASGLPGAVLVGARGPGCVRLVVAPDLSDSMSDYSQAREAALQELLPWARTQLRDDDELEIINWAGTAATVLPPTAMKDYASMYIAQASVAGGTALGPVVDTIAAQEASTCRTHLVLVSDGEIADLSYAADRDLLAAARVEQVSLLMPSPSMDPPGEFTAAFPYASTLSFDGMDPDATGLAFAEAVAMSTGQEVQGR